MKQREVTKLETLFLLVLFRTDGPMTCAELRGELAACSVECSAGTTADRALNQLRADGYVACTGHIFVEGEVDGMRRAWRARLWQLTAQGVREARQRLNVMLSVIYGVDDAPEVPEPRHGRAARRAEGVTGRRAPATSGVPHLPDLQPEVPDMPEASRRLRLLST